MPFRAPVHARPIGWIPGDARLPPPRAGARLRQ